MRINSQLEQKIIRGFHATLIAGTFGFSSYCLVDTIEQENIKNKKARMFIEKTDNKKYFELIKQERKMKIVNWQEEAQKIETTLKIDSIAKKNYALGLKVVRDSLANGNKK